MKWKLEYPVGVSYLPVPALGKQISTISIESKLDQKKRVTVGKKTLKCLCTQIPGITVSALLQLEGGAWG